MTGEITTGVWKISCGPLWLRDVDGEIKLSPEEGGTGDHLSKWQLDYGDSEQRDFTITNVETGARAWVAPPEQLLITPGESTKWAIRSAGDGKHHIVWPNDDFYWTAAGIVPGPVVLEHFVGLPTQLWEFKWVGDF